MDDAEPILRRLPRAWFHGSPLRLEFVRAGSTVTPIVELARVFSHKPSRVEVNIAERDGVRTVSLTHTGTQDGYLYRVLVDDPEADLSQHPTSVMAPGEEMLTRRDLPLEFLCALPMAGEPPVYVLTETTDSL
ncbi:MAG TPA: hypothetical protein PK794_08890 [Armatimonadota bacterium]|nr:hypothetical protein [Armatimonadota bacterium]